MSTRPQLFETWANTLNECQEFFQDPSHWPLPDNKHWAQNTSLLSTWEERVRRQVMEPFSDVVASVMDDIDQQMQQATDAQRADEKARFTATAHAAATDVVQTLASAWVSAGEDTRGRRLLQDGMAKVFEPGVRDEMRAAAHHVDAFALVVAAQFCLGAHKQRKADALFEKAKEACAAADTGGAPSSSTGKTATVSTHEQSYLPFVVQHQQATRPAEKTPELRQNSDGTGTKFVGRLDERDDGSYATTLWWCLLNIPVFPKAAYRVADNGEDSYRLFGSEPLPSGQLWVRRGWGAAVLGVVLAACAVLYVDSDGVVTKEQFASAKALEAEGKHAAAIVAYCELLQSNRSLAGSVEDAIGAQLWGLVRRDLPTPLTHEAVPDATKALRQCSAKGRDHLMIPAQQASFTTWVEDLEAEQPVSSSQTPLRRVKQRLKLLQEGERRGLTSPRHSAQDVDDIVLARTSITWPLSALPTLLTRVSAPAVERTDAILQSMGDDVEVWMAQPTALMTAIVEAKRVKPAHAARAADALRLQSKRPPWSDELLDDVGPNVELTDALRQWQAHLKDHPKDVLAAARMAQVHLAQRQPSRALQTLAGPAVDDKWLPLDALRVKAQALAAAEQPTQAEPLMVHVFDQRREGFARAALELSTYATDLERRTVAYANNGGLSQSEIRRLNRLSETNAQREFGLWLDKEMDKDIGLQKRRANLEAQASTASLAMEVGLLEMQLAAASTGATKKQRLQKAESAFELLQLVGAGAQSQVHLGEVKIRLGHEDKGKTMLEEVHGRGVPGDSMAVARVYRAVGDVARSKTVCEEVYASAADEKFKHSAASMRAVMEHDLDAKETWLRRSDLNDEYISTALRNVEARRLSKDGDHEGAAKKLKEVALFYEKQTGSSVSANNAGLAWMERYSELRDPVDARKGVKQLRKASALAPQEPITKANLYAALLTEAQARFLTPLFDPQKARLSHSETTRVLGALLQGRGTKDPLSRKYERLLPKRELLRLARETQLLSPTSPDAYGNLLLLLDDDVNDHAEIRRLLQTAKERTLDVHDAEVAHLESRLEVGKGNAAKARAQRMQELEKQLASSTAGTTLRAVWLLSLARLQRAEAMATLQVDTAEAHRQSLQQAARAWPKLQLESDLARAELLVGIARHHQTTPLADVERDTLSNVGVSVWLASMAQRNAGWTKGLLQRDEAQPVLQLARRIEQHASNTSGASSVRSTTALVAARIHGGPLSDKTAATVFTEAEQDRDRLRAILAPYDPYAQTMVGLPAWLVSRDPLAVTVFAGPDGN